MATKNDITGDTIKTKTNGTDKYRDNYDSIFGNKKDAEKVKESLTFWEHYCIMDKMDMHVEKGQPCNWCGLYEEDFIEIMKQDI
jgi:hypothetical protein